MPHVPGARPAATEKDAAAEDQHDPAEPASSDRSGAPDVAAGTLSADAGADPAGAGAEPATTDVGPEESVTGSAVIAGPPTRAGARRSRRVVMTAMLGLAAIILGSLATWATVTAHRLRAVAADANIAFVDQAATRSVTHDVTAAVNTIFSYSYADTARTRAAAQSLLTGAAIRQYNALFALVERQAPREKLVVTTRVTNIGVEFLTGDRARVLVFADEQDTRSGSGQTSYGGAMFAVTVGLHGGRWKIEGIDTFTAPG